MVNFALTVGNGCNGAFSVFVFKTNGNEKQMSILKCLKFSFSSGSTVT